MPAILFGSISTVADTSELQREAFNEAFAAHDLGWEWSREEYLGLLESSGGEQRIADYAEQRGQEVDAAAVHQTKSERFQQNVATAGIEPRPGVVETMTAAREAGDKVALVTTTSKENVDALVGALAPGLPAFDLLVDASQVDASKPDPAAYRYALEQLDLGAEDSVAIEDNLGGVQAAKAAGVRCVAFPNTNTAGHDFGAADDRVEQLDATTLTQG